MEQPIYFYNFKQFVHLDKIGEYLLLKYRRIILDYYRLNLNFKEHFTRRQFRK